MEARKSTLLVFLLDCTLSVFNYVERDHLNAFNTFAKKLQNSKSLLKNDNVSKTYVHFIGFGVTPANLSFGQIMSLKFSATVLPITSEPVPIAKFSELPKFTAFASCPIQVGLEVAFEQIREIKEKNPEYESLKIFFVSDGHLWKNAKREETIAAATKLKTLGELISFMIAPKETPPEDQVNLMKEIASDRTDQYDGFYLEQGLEVNLDEKKLFLVATPHNTEKFLSIHLNIVERFAAKDFLLSRISMGLDEVISHPILFYDENYIPTLDVVGLCEKEKLYDIIKDEELKETEGPIEDSERRLVYLYTREDSSSFEETFYYKLNKAMRTNEDVDQYRDYIFNLDSILAKLPSNNQELYRAIGKKCTYENGSTVVWPSFSSCSEDLRIIKEFLRNSNEASVFRISPLESNSRSHDISMHSSKNEKEVLFRSNSTFKVVGVDAKRMKNEIQKALNIDMKGIVCIDLEEINVK